MTDAAIQAFALGSLAGSVLTAAFATAMIARFGGRASSRGGYAAPHRGPAVDAPPMPTTSRPCSAVPPPPTPLSVQVVLREGPPSRLRESWQPHPDATGADPARPPRGNPSNPR